MALTPSQQTLLAGAIRQAALQGSDAAVLAFATGTLAERAALVKPFVQASLSAAQAGQASQAQRNANETTTLAQAVTDANTVLALFP